MQQVILGLLMLHGPLSLYAVQRLFAQGMSLLYSASFGSIRRSLTQLVDRGHVTVAESTADPRGAKPYTITDSGARAWRTWMRAPLTGGDFETAALSKTFFLGLLDDTAERAGVVDAIAVRVEADIAELERLAETVDATDVPADLADVFAFQRATLDYGIRSHQQARNWFDALGRRIEADASRLP